MSEAVMSMVGLLVEDVSRSLQFYRHLGLEVPDTHESGHVQINVRNDITLFLDSDPHLWDPDLPRDLSGKWGESYRSVYEFDLQTETAVRTKFDEMVTLGYAGLREPYRTQFGMCFAFLLDPDGHTILISGVPETDDVLRDKS